MSNRFLTAKGTPASGSLDLSPVASTAFALARARSAVTAVKAFKVGLRAAITASACSVTASAVVSPEATAAAISDPVDQVKSLLMVRP